MLCSSKLVFYFNVIMCLTIILLALVCIILQEEGNNDYMAYWLSNTSTLLFLLEQTLISTASTPRKPPQPTSFFGRMFRSSPSSANLNIGGLDGIRQVEAKYPALLFKQQLTAYVEKIYGIIMVNSKKDLSPLLSSCIQVGYCFMSCLTTYGTQLKCFESVLCVGFRIFTFSTSFYILWGLIKWNEKADWICR